MASLGSLCTGCMLVIQYCYAGGCIKHKANGTLQACNILRLHYVVNSTTGALPAADRCMYTVSCLHVGSCGCVVINSVYRELSVMDQANIKKSIF